MSLSEDELTQIAAPLASYLMPDRDSAKLLVKKSLEGYETYIELINRRKYHDTNRRNRLIPNARQVLQLVVYEKSAEIEKKLFSHSAFPLSLENFYILYIKNLIWQGTFRNAVWTGTAICRILFAYEMSEQLEIFRIAVPSDYPDEAHLRLIKGKLAKQIKAHFGELVSLMYGPRNTIRIKSNPFSPDYWEQVHRCLHMLRPLDTQPCPLQAIANFDNEIDALKEAGFNQCHVMICPECLSKIITCLGYDELKNKLVLPEDKRP